LSAEGLQAAADGERQLQTTAEGRIECDAGDVQNGEEQLTQLLRARCRKGDEGCLAKGLEDQSGSYQE
jgi:hypothetical protein